MSLTTSDNSRPRRRSSGNCAPTSRAREMSPTMPHNITHSKESPRSAARYKEPRCGWGNAEKWCRASLGISQRTANEYNQAGTLHQLGTVAQARGRLEEAEQWYRQSLVLEHRLGNEVGLVNTLHNLGSIAQVQKRLDE